jgi:hypothetical protein
MKSTRKPTTASRPAPMAPESTVWELCREWRLVHAKLQYDLAALPDTMEAADDTGRLCDVANERIHEIEEALAASEPDTFDDVQAILAVVLKNMRDEHMGEDRDRGMVKAAHTAMNRLRNSTSGGSRIGDLEPAVHDLANMAGIASGLAATMPDDKDAYAEFMFAVYQTTKLAHQLRDNYMAAAFPKERQATH